MDVVILDDSRLIIDGSIREKQLQGKTDDFEKIECLIIKNQDLTTLKGFPDLPNLKKVK